MTPPIWNVSLFPDGATLSCLVAFARAGHLSGSPLCVLVPAQPLVPAVLPRAVSGTQGPCVLGLHDALPIQSACEVQVSPLETELLKIGAW